MYACLDRCIRNIEVAAINVKSSKQILRMTYLFEVIIENILFALLMTYSFEMLCSKAWPSQK